MNIHDPVDVYELGSNIPCAVHKAAVGEPCGEYEGYVSVCWDRISTARGIQKQELSA